ncbi:MAG: repair protein RadA [Frankiales bacterium]|jgi:DNA repair protein RadA/Sms|nr:repair protein RadA [Frankiales bacterium]
MAARPAPKERPVHRCAECGASFGKWLGQCPQCQAWGSITESAAVRALPGLRTAGTGSAPTRPARPVSEVVADRVPRQLTGLAEFDRVLGGGLVAGQVVLLAGEPGVGKSTLLGAVAHAMALRNTSSTVLYVSGEESVEQISVRARRTGAVAPGILLADETDLGSLLGHVEAHDPCLLIVDSVQAMASASVEGRAGGMSQVQEVTQVLVRIAKSRRMPLLLIGQSTRENAVAGPRALEHMVDTVLTFEGDKHTALRMLRAVKNRYGPADEVVCFEQADDGLREVPDPSDLFRSHREVPVAGTAVAVAVDGRRAVPAEVQALVAEATSANPRRGVNGLDASRVAMLLAVTERDAGLRFDRDVFVATVGGAKLSDPACDLAICTALAGAMTGAAVPADVAVIGEVALSGDIRPVAQVAVRVAEAARLGYRRILVPPGTLRKVPTLPAGVSLHELEHLRKALEALARYVPSSR